LKHFPEYNQIKPLFGAILEDVEKKLGSKYEMVRAMGIPNWTSETNLDLDADYYKLIVRFVENVQVFNAYIDKSTLPLQFSIALQCLIYIAGFELAGKRVLRAAEMLKGKEMNELGSAIFELRKLGHSKAMKSFDVPLRNGIAHANYLITQEPRPKVEYANIHIDKKTGSKEIQRGSKTLSEIRQLGRELIFFLMGSLYAYDSKYRDLMEDSLTRIS
jgi:hypothetical protein